MQETPPGWYLHSDGGLHWWNGQQWADPPSVKPPPGAAVASETPTAQVEPPAGAPGQRPQQEVGGTLPPKARRVGRTWALVIGGLVAASFVASEVQASRDDPGTAPQPVAAVSNPADGCQRFLSLFTGLLRDKPDDGEADRRVQQLRDAAREDDPLLASDLQDMLNADSGAEVSAAAQIIVRRCGAAGHVTQEDVNRLGAAAMSAIGAAPVAPRPTTAVAPAPAIASEPTPEPAAELEEEEPLYATDELSTGEPTCADVLPILKRHPKDMRAWLSRFERGVAGTPWAAGQYVTLYSLSPDTGDPIRQTLTVADSLLDDYDLNDEASGDDIPNRMPIYMEDGAVACG